MLSLDTIDLTGCRVKYGRAHIHVLASPIGIVPTLVKEEVCVTAGFKPRKIWPTTDRPVGGGQQQDKDASPTRVMVGLFIRHDRLV